MQVDAPVAERAVACTEHAAHLPTRMGHPCIGTCVVVPVVGVPIVVPLA